MRPGKPPRGSPIRLPSTRRLLIAVLIAAPLALVPARAVAAPSVHDGSLREGWRLLADERFAEARAKFGAIPPGEYDLGDYALYFRGLAEAGAGDLGGAASTFRALESSFPDSPLVPYLAHELAWASAREEDLAGMRSWSALSRGKVSGNGRRSEEGYIAARLLEEDEAPQGSRPARPEGKNGAPDPASGAGAGPGLRDDPVAEASDAARPEQGVPSRRALHAHLDNFAAFAVHDGGVRSMERIWKWRSEGKLAGLDLPVTVAGKLARALVLAGETDRARAVYKEAIRRFPPSDEYYAVLLDFAEFLRSRWDTRESREILARALEGAPAGLRPEIDFLYARVELKAGRPTEARNRFLEIAARSTNGALAERARYHAAWIAEEEGDIAAAQEEFGRLRTVRDEGIRQEALFRHAFALYRLGRHDDAARAFARGEKEGFSSVERARHAFWRGRLLAATGDAGGAETAMASVASNPGAGPYALFAARSLGRDPYGMLNAPPSGETGACAGEKTRLWEAVLAGEWDERDAAKVRRAARLTELGVIEYAILEADRIDRGNVRRVTGVAEGGAPGLFRYLAGDLKGAIRETNAVPTDSASREAGLIDRLQFPLAPEFVGDCEKKRSGVDPLVLHAVIRQESQFQQNVLSPAGAVGLMQLMPKTAAEVARREKKRVPRRKDLLNPERNVALGAAYFARLLKGYGGDYLRAVAAYNAGEAAVARWWDNAEGDPALFLERMTYRETRFYVRRVFFNLLQYYRIYRPATLARHFPIGPAEGQPAPDASGPPPAGSTPGESPAGGGAPEASGTGG